jgi:hypothetical protein
MNDQGFIAIQFDHDVFRAPPETQNVAACQAILKIDGKRNSKVVTANINPDESMTYHRRLQPLFYGFDFRQLGQ